MNITFRKADLSDLPVLVETRCEVLKAVFGLPEDADMELIKTESEKYYEENITNGRHVAYMAYHDGEFAGCGAICYYGVMPSPDNPTGRYGYIMNMYTRPVYRNNGIAGGIVDILVRGARERGLKKVMLETTAKARSIYTRYGFTDLGDVMELSL